MSIDNNSYEGFTGHALRFDISTLVIMRKNLSLVSVNFESNNVSVITRKTGLITKGIEFSIPIYRIVS